MEKNIDKAKGIVWIRRHSGDYIGGPFPAEKIERVCWGRVSGGVHRLQNGWSLYGYVPYEDAMDIVSCSGSHNFGYNEMKICITAADNKDNPNYRAAYYGLVEEADERAGCGIAANCPNGGPTCTKRIRELLREKRSITRREIRDTLLGEGYGQETIRESIKNLYYQEILDVDGAWQSLSQIIRLR